MLDEAVGDQHRRADQQDLQHRHGGDGRIDLPFEVLQDGDRQRRAARARPGTGSSPGCRTRMTKPNSAAATTPGRMAGSVTWRNVVQRSAPRLCAASSIERSKPARLAVTRRTVQGMMIITCPAIEPGERAQDRQPGGELDLDMEHIEARCRARRPAPPAAAAAGCSAPRGRESESAQGTGRRHAEAEADHRRDHGHLQAEQEAADETVVAGDGREPAQRVALRRERRDLLAEEGEPADEEERRQDVGELSAAAPLRRCGRAERRTRRSAAAGRRCGPSRRPPMLAGAATL